MTVRKLKKLLGSTQGGFTLIELLIVIAILGVLAVVVLVAINPVEQLAKTRDTGRISTVTQLGHALEAYYTSRNAQYPGAVGAEADWGTNLTTSGELSTFPTGVAYTAYGVTACTENAEPTAGAATDTDNFCYDFDATNGALVYAIMESESQNSKCSGGDIAVAVFSTADGRGGIVCDADGALDPWAAGTQAYQ